MCKTLKGESPTFVINRRKKGGGFVGEVVKKEDVAKAQAKTERKKKGHVGGTVCVPSGEGEEENCFNF